jgi:hypothetical protein
VVSVVGFVPVLSSLPFGGFTFWWFHFLVTFAVFAKAYPCLVVVVPLLRPKRVDGNKYGGTQILKTMHSMGTANFAQVLIATNNYSKHFISHFVFLENVCNVRNGFSLLDFLFGPNIPSLI